MAFQKTWRAYQSRILEHLDSYVADKRFHLVAAPGSGKTVLGLEVVRRINQPTLVLAPTITIRNQWADRLVELFLRPGEGRPAWVSTDLKKPALLTLATYQALHAECAGVMNEEGAEQAEEERVGNGGIHEECLTLPDNLVIGQFRTLVVDEAHHLRSEWWKTLTFVAERLREPTIVALTATPPYDVSAFEWERYEGLCGAVDAEVSVPELVLQGDLCPHQDYVYFSAPSPREQKTLSDFRGAVDLFVQELRGNKAFIATILAHPWISKPDEHAEEILETPEYLSSMIIYLRSVDEQIPTEALRVLGLPLKGIPALNLEWLEILLTQSLYNSADRLGDAEALLKSVRQQLLKLGAIEHRKVKLRLPADQMKLLTSSVTKLKSIQEIVSLESSSQGSELRCVILTDFIRKAELPKNGDGVADFEDVGVVPIFETLRQAELPNARLGVLSGSLAIIPSSADASTRQAAAALGLRSDDLLMTPLQHDNRYSAVELRGEHHQGMVRLLTSVFEGGEITVLIGTKSLLGEGWDAPCINTLVLASFVGSYVLSNQMRGRSIRVDTRHPEKTANIWHLVCVEPGIFGPGEDYELLVRRCSAFAGVSTKAAVIENGAQRLALGSPPFSQQDLTATTLRTCGQALDRGGLRRRWQEALTSAENKEMVDGLKAPVEILPRGFVLTNTIGVLLVQAGFIFAATFLQLMRAAGRVKSDNLLSYMALVAAIAAAVSSPWAARAIWRLIRHGTPERSMRQIGYAVLDALRYAGAMDRHSEPLRIYANRNDDGTVFCWIGNGSGKEQATFVRALREALGPIMNPRYLLARGRLWRFVAEDYFAVPEVLARKKEFAEKFAEVWRSRVGAVELIFTRTPEGRRQLLRARFHSLAAAFQKRSERVSCWK